MSGSEKKIFLPPQIMSGSKKIFSRPKRRDVRNRNVNEEEVVEREEEEEEEEFSSTEQEEETEPNFGKRLRRNRTRRRSRQRTNRASKNNFEHFDVFFME